MAGAGGKDVLLLDESTISRRGAGSFRDRCLQAIAEAKAVGWRARIGRHMGLGRQGCRAPPQRVASRISPEKGMAMKRILVMVGVLASMIAWPVPVGASPSFPASVPLPTGFYPEGIAVGSGHDFYVGSLFGGAVYKGDLRTGQGQILASGVQGRVVSGLSLTSVQGCCGVLALMPPGAGHTSSTGAAASKLPRSISPARFPARF